jgi:hypothetical protein
MALGVFLGFFILGATLALAVRGIAPERRVLLHALAIAALAPILAKTVLVLRPSLEPLFDGSPLFVYLERDFAVPFGVAFFALAARLVPDPRSRRSVAVMPWVLLAYLTVSNACFFTTPACYVSDDNRWTGDGVCLQSTDYTCGPASIATLLRRRGVADATEHDAARLSATIPGRGMTDLGATMALRHFLPGKKVTIESASVDDLANVPVPCLAPLRYSFFFDHMTVLLGVEKKGFVIGDPLLGRVVLSRAELASRWLGHVITVER